jgi:hypothetical protein
MTVGIKTGQGGAKRPLSIQLGQQPQKKAKISTGVSRVASGGGSGPNTNMMETMFQMMTTMMQQQGGKGQASSGGLDDNQWKGAFHNVLKIKEMATPEYVSEQNPAGSWQSTVTIEDKEYKSQGQTKKLAESLVAKKVMKALFPDEFKAANQKAAKGNPLQQLGVKQEQGTSGEARAQLQHSLTVYLYKHHQRNISKDDVKYEIEEVQAATGIRYQATVTLPDDLGSHQGALTANKKEANELAAKAACKALKGMFASLLAEKAAEKKQKAAEKAAEAKAKKAEKEAAKEA